MLWIVFVVLTAAVMALLLLPVLRPPAAAPARADFDRAVFRDQLAELDRDVERGAIGIAEAEAARNEISRRVLAAGRPAAGPKADSPLVAIVGILIIPLVALPLYWAFGHPMMADVPRAERLANAVANQDMPAMLAQVESHLDANPNDLQGWQVIAPAYRRAERYDDAARAYKRILELSQPTAETMADLGEVLVYANRGMVPAEAVHAFAGALQLDASMPKARFFMAVALKQQGKAAEAKAAFEALLKDSPGDAPWRPAVEAELNPAGSSAPSLSQDQMAAGASMPAGDQQAMIRSMVDGLETKLKTDGNNLGGWLRLIRARSVLNEPDKARAALASARAQFKDQPDAQGQLDGLAKELNLL
jgi:cytochrome c-type biogenesis protein CcmH